MKIPSIRHPESEELLRYVDGEAPARAASQIRSHLEKCWECRVELEELQNTVGECVRYRKNTLTRHLPPPPAPWTDIYRGFAEIDAALDQASLLNRVSKMFHAPMRYAQRWAPVAVALIVICAVFYRFRQTPSVQAAELLRKAIAAADGRPERPRRIQIRTKDSRIVRTAGATREDAADAIEPLFIAAHYDWNDPLSAKSYQAWRDGLAEKQDEVVEEQGAYLIRTRTGAGELTLATLKIRSNDLRPISERFEFRNRDWVEISELPDDAPRSPEVAAAPESTRTKPPAVRVATATIGDELQVLATLRRVDADLGDPIEVSRAGGQVVVTGVGIAAQRRQEINDALGSQSRVVVRFSETAPPPAHAEDAAPADSTINVEIKQLQGRVADQIGGRAYFAQLATQILDLSEPMMARAYALRRLAERVPTEMERELTAQDWQVLRDLQQEHTEALRRQTVEIDRVLRPALAPVSGPVRAPNGVAFSGAWQPAAEELFQSARRVDKLLAIMFGAAAGESPGDQLPAQLLASLAELRARVEAYGRLPLQSIERTGK